MIIRLLQIFGSLGVFLYGMRVMSDGLQKVAGERLQKILHYMTKNRVIAVITGIIITAFIQSSSATTVMLVSFVNAGLLTLVKAIGVIMGANIGTTVTTWLVSLVGFKFKITAIALPIAGLSLPFLFAKSRTLRDTGEIIIGFALLFLGLMFLKNSVPDIHSNPEILQFVQNYTDLGFLSIIIFIGIGTFLTIIIQSSSAAMAITVTLAYMGWIDFPMAAAMTLGENIGTTVTANIAAIGTNLNARRAARAHFFFNTLGIIWILIIFPYFIKFIEGIAPWDSAVKENFPLNLALFHSVFNITNTLIFLPFVPLFAKFIEKLFPQRKQDILPQQYKLKYISASVQDTPGLNILEAKNEIIKMADVTHRMFTRFIKVLTNPTKDMSKLVKIIKNKEDLTDQMQVEISKYLVDCSKDAVSSVARENINAMMRIVHELESVADSCYRLILLIQKKYNKKIIFAEVAVNDALEYSNLILEFINFYKANINNVVHLAELNQAYEMEKEIDLFRNKLKKKSRKRIQEGGDVNSELMYIDLLRYFEHIGDNSQNIIEALEHIK
ncbi:MAG: Na/Pi cotransporter family protein [Candidatus Cloacimonadota bacterium]|nr:Na/Pi cotransporter family protein [Candidatus Cloacimonadota bacterium]